MDELVDPVGDEDTSLFDESFSTTLKQEDDDDDGLSGLLLVVDSSIDPVQFVGSVLLDNTLNQCDDEHSGLVSDWLYEHDDLDVSTLS